MANSIAYASARASLGPLSLAQSIWRNRSLIASMLNRELGSRYKGSFLGPLWFLVTPALMIIIFTFVFGVVFQARVPYRAADSNPIEFGVYLFSGMLIFQIFSEAISRAPTMILSNAPFVKRVIFPLEILSIVAVAAAYVNGALSFVALIASIQIVYGAIPAGALAYPLIALTMAPLLVGLVWIFASLGVYVRDVGQFIGIILTTFMFLSPIFFPLERLPEFLRSIVMFNPVTVPIEAGHVALFAGTAPALTPLLIYTFISFAVMLAGWATFQRLRPGFADVI